MSGGIGGVLTLDVGGGHCCWCLSLLVTWQPCPVWLVVFSKRGQRGICTGYSPQLWVAVTDDGRSLSLAAMAIGSGVVWWWERKKWRITIATGFQIWDNMGHWTGR